MTAYELSTVRRLAPRWIWPGFGPVLERTHTLVREDDGRVVFLPRGPNSDETTDADDVLLTPGLTNFHCHLELSQAARPDMEDSGARTDDGFVDWLLEVIRSGAMSAEQSAAAAAVAGAEECIAAGVTHVYDITRKPAEVRAALAATPLRVTSFAEVTGRGPRREQSVGWIARAESGSGLTKRVRPGISPHAPYSTDEATYRRCMDLAEVQGWPLMTHLAEVGAERTFLRGGADLGAFGRLWGILGESDPARLVESPFPGGPVAWFLSMLPDAPPTGPLLLAHVNDVGPGDLAAIARCGARVVHCPRTHAYFGRAAFDLPGYLDAGVSVKVGTDSRASSPDLDLMEDLRLLHRLHPTLPLPRLLSMVMPLSLAGGEATVGVGAVPTDWLAWRVGNTANPLRAIFETAGLKPAAVYSNPSADEAQ